MVRELSWTRRDHLIEGWYDSKMFGLIKPKMSVDALADVFVSTIGKVLVVLPETKIDKLVRDFVTAGANMVIINFELAAFTAFTVWAGAALALQKNKISEDRFDELQNLINKRLGALADTAGSNAACISSFGYSFSQLLEKRMELYISIATESAPEMILPSLIDMFCQIVSIYQPIELKVLTQSTYLLSAGAAYDLIANTKLSK
jgi:hypothetical protein